ncbi:MAG: arylamine N-acetyltransferase [Oscillospiraceae bacterium]|nr:arylamine N-acetyltransferase [Oscillospiraceae bacterium]
MTAVPFENLDMLLEKPVSLDWEVLWDKLLVSRRGGVCHELNHAFYYLLQALGFDVSLGSAGVDTDDDELEHMNIRVKLKGKTYLVDVGFASGLIPPLCLEEGAEQTGYGERFLFRREEGDVLALLKFDRATGMYQPLHRLYRPERRAADFIPGFQAASIPGATPFSSYIICSRGTQENRCRLVRNRLMVSNSAGARKILIGNREECITVLERYFGISPAPDFSEARWKAIMNGS